MINHFMKNRVQWKHINNPSFLFKLAKYPQFMVSKNKNNPLASISALCHNNLKYTIKCIEGILVKTKPEFELLITDNCSTDNTYQYLKSINDSRVTVSCNNKNIGFIQAHNEALKKAKGIYFIAFNNDLIIKGNWLKRII